MPNGIFFESHNELMHNIPVIFHRDAVKCRINSDSFHLHRNIEILYIRHGSGFIFCGDKYIRVKENDTVIVNSNSLHGFASDDFMDYDCLILDRNFLLENGVDTDKIFFIPHICNNTFINSEFDRLIAAFQNKNEFFKLNISSITLSLISYLCENFSTEKQEDTTSDKMTEAVTYILKNLFRNLTADEIAAVSGYSKYHFIRKFKSFTGKTPVEFINARRCEYAKDLLLGTELSVKEIADSVGFENPSYFSKVFSDRFGCSPCEYSKKYEK